ncbi:hypothetical protein KC980_02650 [candidate division WWE3 bacterium]|uniref:DUF5666 domain-containing protein n=1 Tax=candidate division WWE3 bacterium TaxID=2053526 RepID=A0A955ECV3_UNCKA|nr:hypothetical protein [candidate division WWE3 bacterium]
MDRSTKISAAIILVVLVVANILIFTNLDFVDSFFGSKVTKPIRDFSNNNSDDITPNKSTDTVSYFPPSTSTPDNGFVTVDATVTSVEGTLSFGVQTNLGNSYTVNVSSETVTRVLQSYTDTSSTTPNSVVDGVDALSLITVGNTVSVSGNLDDSGVINAGLVVLVKE